MGAEYREQEGRLPPLKTLGRFDFGPSERFIHAKIKAR